jgi:hypothetical protein
MISMVSKVFENPERKYRVCTYRLSPCPTHQDRYIERSEQPQ